MRHLPRLGSTGPARWEPASEGGQNGRQGSRRARRSSRSVCVPRIASRSGRGKDDGPEQPDHNRAKGAGRPRRQGGLSSSRTAWPKPLNQTAPWVLAKAEQAGDMAAGQRLDTVLSSLVEAQCMIAEALRPFLPDTAVKLAEQLGIALAADWSAALARKRCTGGRPIPQASPLFPRIETAAS